MFQTGEINFCEGTAFNIKCDNKKKEILDYLFKFYNIKIIKTHYLKFSENHISKINEDQQLIFTKSNGNSYFLYLTKINDINTCIFIDKKIKQNYFYPRMIITHFKFSDLSFNENIFDGEMIKDNNNKWKFIINNILVRDKKIIENNAVEKINIIDNFLTNYYNSSIINICEIYMKNFFSYVDIEYVLNKYVPSLDYNIRGIYFRGLNSKIDILIDLNNDLIIKKEKNIVEHVIRNNFDKNNYKLYNIKKTSLPDVFNIYTLDDKFIDSACICTLKISKYMYNLFKNRTMEDKVLMLFTWDKQFEKFVPVID